MYMNMQHSPCYGSAMYLVSHCEASPVIKQQLGLLRMVILTGQMAGMEYIENITVYL